MSEKEEVVLKILDYLNEIEVRATYGAVAEVLGVLPRSVGQQFLGEKRPYASWVVREDTGLPTDYLEDQLHPKLLSKKSLIKSGSVLRRNIGLSQSI
ncbi:hypothetical protein AB6F11_10630 [Vibrio sp. 10N.247.311.14]|uniref:hypothetical protein n=1 Tax=Vibrio TaxID=662 RepID=UPI000CABE966|nr:MULTISPECIES: hypothetical protein [Vibrio]MDN3680326.1 hypothetical protein [Vibrio tapetis subsp. quintayensis]PMK20727.1 hypothetical protein BCU05_13900 [Vibrio sp. 10N.261.54.C3]TKF37556.1 hypothetical protein FCV57_18295 [Vibrio sp. F13]TKF66063.1 hypothetical protein FCV58_11410 [Vibrio sp. F13]